VTGRVAPGTVGEVTLQIRGGSEAFYAYASDPRVIIEKGVKVKVDDHQPPLTVFVSPVEPAKVKVDDHQPPLTVFVSPVEPAPPVPPDQPARSLIQDTLPSRPPHHSYT